MSEESNQMTLGFSCTVIKQGETFCHISWQKRHSKVKNDSDRIPVRVNPDKFLVVKKRPRDLKFETSGKLTLFAPKTESFPDFDG